ncbi:MAG: hypothetical protein A2087_01775 [Spirochaetes bacterium GWD1_61_31]|nr:MAG: hypothetical protein A2Y37_10140 [Spirochaetes bacterium GWB1_60_80]OHD29058.1 MAG: hypothetical protein A2004_14500 [Spirochaetes bacterium GWC1_61_12]OHD35908.1 MAG: hypothetical protein A2087_01775 [Spirochaetes bacterium GWD1_61_31]OHD44225.1 MAG: hypothetical protein A2Y35_06705 [Spirochaetes bacterium GWE1_60_18]OHD60415.1 MAG: hypothetical protein A2Y32_00820 [Spirochaetes bacterium GWF1_60_12]HAP43266.1 hypothetical protein [Spirochaetaceae bacterium]
MKRQLLLLLLCAAVLMPALAQTASPNPAEVLPQPYERDEFPDWLWSVRRFEIIALGVFPFALFYTRVGFDLSRFIANGFDPSYAPWPFSNEFSYKPTDEEQITSLLIAGGVALVFAGVDALILHLRPDN